MRRDFWDLHALLTTGAIALNDALEAYLQRFKKSEPDLYHVLRALTFFDDAEREPLMPAGLTPEHWQDIRRAAHCRKTMLVNSVPLSHPSDFGQAP